MHMAEPLKRFFDAALIRSIAESPHEAYPRLRTNELAPGARASFAGRSRSPR
jgi:hypothetical protein